MIHLPNITLASKVTVVRILGVPVFILLLLDYTLGLGAGNADERYRTAALALFLVIAVTDALDGYLARSRREITRLGSILDPIADKLLLLSSLILLTRPSLPSLQPQFPVAYTLLVISRDAVLVAGAFIINNLTGRVHIRPRLTGKVATFAQMVAITMALAAAPPHPFHLAIWIAGIFTFVSGAQYLYDGILQFEKEHGTST